MPPFRGVTVAMSGFPAVRHADNPARSRDAANVARKNARFGQGCRSHASIELACGVGVMNIHRLV